jgi:SAM-dependent methyltransferase
MTRSCDAIPSGHMRLILRFCCMQTPQAALTHPPKAFDKVDQANDDIFYAEARLVNHIDDLAVGVLTEYYSKILPPKGLILDLMSSWVSHLPSVFTGKVIGHGMNEKELMANPRLGQFFVQNLNVKPLLPLASASLDAALCCAGVQYLTQPEIVFSEVARVLRPGAPFAVSFSNRCFPTKAVAIWRGLNGEGHAQLIAFYLNSSGFKKVERHVLCDGSAGDPMTVVTGYR